jgi:hypothetical protein
MSAKSSGGGSKGGKEAKGGEKGKSNSGNGVQEEVEIIYEHRHIYLTEEILEEMTIAQLEDIMLKCHTIPNDMAAFIRDLIKAKKQKKV